MAAIEVPWATRFYGMAVTPEIVAESRDRLTDSTIEDLVEAHLAINYAYFGAIDKTLSGFVILDDEGDDCLLLDLRDGDQVWWQDHETRELSLRYDSLADLIAVRAAPEDERDAVEAKRRAKQPRSLRAVTTPALCARYQWLVWQLARHLERDDRPTQTTDYLVRNGIGRFRYVFPRKEVLDTAFAAE